ncbi:MAG TPA: SusC/RagA family TonB-linked outer membrane protein [Puia sp.]|nr:SusC/RagA family TonB-linked outer membrane protein [Puia sp.]
MRSFRKLSFLLGLLCVSLFAVSQNISVSGRVTDSKGNGVPGVNVLVKGTAKGTATATDGRFTISAPANATLVFSGIGFATQEVAVAGQTTVDVTLIEKQNELNEVVVTALGITRQAKSLSYSTQTVKTADLIGVRDNDNVIGSLQGKVANAYIVQGSGGVGSGAQIVLRGNRSIAGSNNALIVVDGVPITNNTYSAAGSDFGSVQGSDGASSVNPDDIESMNILTGGTAAVLYGPEGANGAVVITTKKGLKNGIQINLNSGVSVVSPWSLPKFQNTYGQGIGGHYVDSLTGASWGPVMDGHSYINHLAQQSTFSPAPDNVKDFFRTAPSFNNSVSIQGGGEHAQTYLSYTNNSNSGIVIGNSMIRHTVTLRETNQFNKFFSTDAKITYIAEDIKNRPRTGEENAPTIDIYEVPRNLSTDVLKQYQYVNNVGVPTPTTFPSTNAGIYGNPYWMVYNTSQNQSRSRIMGFLAAKLQFTPWLSFTARGNLDRTVDNIYTSYNQSTLLWAHTGGYYAQNNIVTTQKWFDGIFEGNNNITKDIKVSYHAGAIFQDNRYDIVNNTADGLNVTNKFSLNYATNPSMSQQGQEIQTNSLFGQASFSWRDAIFLDGGFREDWASTLPPPYNYPYYGIGVAAVISDLVHLPQSISFMKASVNYGQTGNGGQFGLRTPTYTYSQGAGNGFIQRGTVYPFPTLKPELTRGLEASVDMKFIDNRIGFTATYYKTNSINQLLQLTIPVATGYQYQYINAGNIQNQGFEFIVTGTVIRQRDFNWDVSFNFALNRNKIIKLDPNIKKVDYGGGDNRSATPEIKEGSSFGDLLAYVWLKDSKGNYELSPDGTPYTTYKSGDPQTKIGNYNPKATLGWTNTFRYKGIYLKALIDGRVGGTMVSGTEMNLSFSGITEATGKYRDGGWSLGGVDPNTGSPITTAINAQQFWTTASGQRYGVGQFYAYDATSFRMRELSIGYDIPLHTHVIKAAKISAVASNLFWIYRGSSIVSIPGLGKRKMWFDPDMSLGNGNYQGIEYGTLPSTRSYGLNLQLTF